MVNIRQSKNAMINDQGETRSHKKEAKTMAKKTAVAATEKVAGAKAVEAPKAETKAIKAPKAKVGGAELAAKAQAAHRAKREEFVQKHGKAIAAGWAKLQAKDKKYMTAWRKTAEDLNCRLYGYALLKFGLVTETKDKGYGVH